MACFQILLEVKPLCSRNIISAHPSYICMLTPIRVRQMNIQDKITLKALKAQAKVKP